MPIKIQSDLPVKEILEKENIFVMDESRASHQDIRPIQILILNLMPLKEETELQLLRSLSNTPLQVDVTFMAVQSHEAKNTSVSHLNKFYQTFPELKNNKYDGMIITGCSCRADGIRRGRLLEGTGRDHGLDKHPCYLHHLSVLGCTGRTLPPLWTEKTQT